MKENKKILIVEDEILFALNLKNFFENKGYSVCGILAKGEDVLKKVDEEKPDIVLMDIQLAGLINGIDAAIQINENYKVKIIFLTGYDNNEFRSKALSINPIGYLIKPIQIDQLFSLIESL